MDGAAAGSATAQPELQRATPGRNASVLTAATLAARLTMFGLGIVLARRLGAGEYGRYSFAVALGSVLVPVADLGLTIYLGREIARDRAATERALPVLLAAKAVLFVSTFAVTMAVTLLVVPERGFVLAIGLVTLSSLLDGGSAFAYGYFRGRETMGYEAMATTVAAFARGIGGIVIAVLARELWPVVTWIVLVALVQLALALLRLHRVRRREPRGALMRGLVDWTSVGSMGLYVIFVVVYLRSDSVLIGILQDAHAVGLYAAAYTLMLGAQIAPWMLATALGPVFARTHLRAPAEFGAAWQGGIRLVVLLGLPIALAGSALAEPIIDRLYGPGFHPAVEVLAVIIWVCPVGAISLIVQAALRGARHERRLTLVSGICALVSVGANLWAIPAHGIMGAAVTTVAVELLNVLLLAWLALRARVVTVPRFPLARTAVAGAALVAVARLAIDLPVEVAGLAAVATYVALLFALRVLTPNDLRALARRRPAEVG